MPLSLMRDFNFTTSDNLMYQITTIPTSFETSLDEQYETQTEFDILNKTNITSEWTTAKLITDGLSSKGTTTMSIQEAVEKGLISWDDATWILTSAFIIFTMQSGFGLLEAGCVSSKNEVNIMVKNVMDVVFGGFAYWMFGYGFSFGEGKYSNFFFGWGDFFVDSRDGQDMGLIYSNFIFQLSFATTATTIVSGAMAERTKLSAYIVFSFLNTLVYCIPAHWIWTSKGFLNQLGCVDIAGAGAVHLVGAVSALVATLMLQPRLGRYDDTTIREPMMGNPTNALVGMFMLWWGWLGFNCGSTFGISFGKWKLAAKSSVTTIAGSVGGGVFGTFFSYWWRNKIYEVKDIVNSILGSLVSITAGCAVIHPWESILIGAVGSILAILCTDLLNKLKIDDPVGAVAVHGFCGIWGLISVGLFVEEEPVMKLNNGQKGLFKGGGFYSLGVQALAAVCIIAWSAIISFAMLGAIQLISGLRLTEYEERMGSDYIEHGISRFNGYSQQNGSCNCTNGTNHINTHNRRRSSFGFTRSTDDVVSPVSLLQVTTGLHQRRANGYINRAMELPTITEGISVFHGERTHETVNGTIT